MAIKFIHTADIHLGKTYRNSPGEAERYEDFFLCFSGIVEDALKEKINFVLICGDLFHEGQILPRTFAKTIDVLQPLKNAGIFKRLKHVNGFCKGSGEDLPLMKKITADQDKINFFF